MHSYSYAPPRIGKAKGIVKKRAGPRRKRGIIGRTLDHKQKSKSE